MMREYEKRVIEQMERLTNKVVPRGALRRMAEMGILDMRECERRVITDFVGQRLKRGGTKCNAMSDAAENYNCSYEKIRNIIYSKR